MNGTSSAASSRPFPCPGPTDLFSEPATWKGKWVFLATSAGTAAWRLSRRPAPRGLVERHGGTSPVVAGGLLYVQWSGGIDVYRPTTGSVVGRLPIGEAHWQSPIVVDGRVAAAEGNANAARDERGPGHLPRPVAVTRRRRAVSPSAEAGLLSA